MKQAAALFKRLNMVCLNVQIKIMPAILFTIALL